MTDRAIEVPPSRALVFEVTAFAPFTIETTPSAPDEQDEHRDEDFDQCEAGVRAGTGARKHFDRCRLRACASKGAYSAMAISPMARSAQNDNEAGPKAAASRKTASRSGVTRCRSCSRPLAVHDWCRWRAVS